MQNILQEHIDALIESEKLEEMGKMEYVTQVELDKHIEKIFEDFDKSKEMWNCAHKTLDWEMQWFFRFQYWTFAERFL